MKITGNITYIFSILEFSKEPINQYVIDDNVVVGSAKYFTNDKIDDIKPPTIIPDKIKIIEDPFLNNFEISKVIITVTTPVIKAKTLM